MQGYLKNYATSLLRRVGYQHPIAVVWKDAQTASTNGLVITMPNEFMGVVLNRGNKKPTKRMVKIAKGLILHEITHSLQPLKEIAQAEKDTGLNHFFVNIFLDVQLERMDQVLYASEIDNLYYVRRLIWRTQRKEFLANLKEHASDFPKAAADLNLLGRYCKAKKPYTHLRKAGIRIVDRLRDFGSDTATTPQLVSELPDRVKYIANVYPELCDPALDLPKIPTGEDGFPTMLPVDEESAKDLQECGQRILDLLETVFLKSTRKAPRKAAVMLAAQLNIKMRVDNVASRIIAPVTFDRRKMATGDLQPYYMVTQTGKAKQRAVAILLDVSYSMVSSGIQEQAFVAAQAICMAVEAHHGRCTGGQFGAYGVLTENMDAALLFDDVRPNCTKTSFQLLAAIWMKLETATVIVITDGDGTIPELIKPADKARTHVICLGPVPTYSIEKMGTIHQCDTDEGFEKRLAEIMFSIVN